MTSARGDLFQTKAVLLASGARYRKLGVPGEDQLVGLNIHFCATCDGAFYKGKEVLVVGGGNSGFQEGLMLTRSARKVDIVEFEPQVQASAFLQEQVAKRREMSVIVNHTVKAFKGRHQLETVVAEDRATGEVKEWRYDGVFIGGRLLAGLGTHVPGGKQPRQGGHQPLIGDHKPHRIGLDLPFRQVAVRR